MVNLRDLDYFGKQFSFHFFTNRFTIYKTYLGAVVSLLIWIIYTYTFIDNIVGIQDQTILSSDLRIDKLATPEFINISKNEIEFSIGSFVLINSRVGLMDYSELTKIITPVFYIVQTKFQKDTGVEESNILYKERMKPCSTIEYSELDQLNEFEAVQRKNCVCTDFIRNETKIPRELLFVNGSLSVGERHSIQIVLYPCSLNTSAECISFIESLQVTLVLSYSLLGINLGNITHPITQSKFEVIPLPLDVSSTWIFSTSIIKNRVLDTTYSFLNQRLAAEFIDLSESSILSRARYASSFMLCCTTEQIANEECEPLVIINYKASTTRKTYTRYFSTWMQIIGKAGGLLDIILLGIHFGYHSINLYFFKRKIRRHMNTADHDLVCSIFLDNNENDVTSLEDIVESPYLEGIEATNLQKNIRVSEILTHVLVNKKHRILIPCVLANLHVRNKLKKQYAKIEIVQERYREDLYLGNYGFVLDYTLRNYYSKTQSLRKLSPTMRRKQNRRNNQRNRRITKKNRRRMLDKEEGKDGFVTDRSNRPMIEY